MRNKINLVGRKFGKLTGLDEYRKGKSGKEWLCICECGTIKYIRVTNLLSGQTKSCNCLRFTKGMHSVSDHKDVYHIYISAKNRCNQPNHPFYKDYGARGIKFLFNSFEEFYKEIGPRPSEKYSVDRKDNNLSYQTGNIQWATGSQQVANRRDRKEFNFLPKDLRTFMNNVSISSGIKYPTIRGRYFSGWCFTCLSRPLYSGRCGHIEYNEKGILQITDF